MVLDFGVRKVPITLEVRILPQDRALTSVLVVETPFRGEANNDFGCFDDWRELVRSSHLDVHYLNVVRNQPVLRNLDLSRFDVLLLAGTGLIRLSDSEQARVRQFVSDGGRLIVTADRFFRNTVEAANHLIIPAGLQMADEEAPWPKTFVLESEWVAEVPFAEDVKTVVLHRPSPIAVLDPAKGTILVGAPPFAEQGFVAAGQFGRGRIFVVGQSTWWRWLCHTRNANSDNGRLLANLITLNK
jgi:hypothetical protein